MRLKRFSALLVVFLVVALLTPTLAKAEVFIVGGLSHEKTVEIGQTYKGIIFVKNGGDEPQEAKVYQTDYLFFFDGRNIYGEPSGKDPRSNANWITFSPQRLTIPPKGTGAVNYTIQVPDDESLKGTYWSMFMVEGTGKSSPEVTPEKGKVKAGIRQVMRYGIQMVTNIGESGTTKLEFLDAKLLRVQNTEKRIFQVDIENIGERWLIPQVWTELYDTEGRYIGKFQGGRPRIYPRTSVRYKIDLSDVPKGEYKALVIADAGGDDVFGISYTLKLK